MHLGKNTKPGALFTSGGKDMEIELSGKQFHDIFFLKSRMFCLFWPLILLADALLLVQGVVCMFGNVCVCVCFNLTW